MDIKIRAYDKNMKQMLSAAIVSAMPVSMINSDSAKVFMRWTGLLDREKQLIYEGDIVLYQSTSGIAMGVVKFGQSGFNQCFYIEWDCFNPPRPELFYYTKNNLITVVGNMYENKTLLQSAVLNKCLQDLESQ